MLGRGLGDSFYKVVSESFRVLAVLAQKGARIGPSITTVTLEKLTVSDIDQEVKESAIGCVGVLLARDEFKEQQQLETALSLLFKACKG